MTGYVCTLFEGTYHMGLGALVNSLYRNGFRATLFAGYRGSLPPWAAPVSTKDKIADFAVGEGCRIKFVSLDTPLHLASYKPIFMRRVFEEFLQPEDILCYFDPDITIKCRWSFFEQWVQNGLALVEDCTFPYMPSDHPLRYLWLEMAKSAGLIQKRAPGRYYNSGFVGVPGRLRHVLPLWESLLESARAFGYDTYDVHRHRPHLALAGIRPGSLKYLGDDDRCSAQHPRTRRDGFSPRRLCDVPRSELAETVGERLFEVRFRRPPAEFVG